MLAAGGRSRSPLAALAYGRQAAQQAYDRLLIGAANQIAGAVSVRAGEIVVDIPASAFELLALAPDDRVLYAVFDPDGRVVTGYGRSPAGRRTSPGFARDDFAGEPVRLASVTRRFSERDFTGAVEVVVGQTTRARDALAAEIARSALLVVGLLGLLMAALAAFAIRSALAPLRRIEGGLAAREPRDLTPLDVAVAARDRRARRGDQPLHGAPGAAVRDHAQPDRRRLAPAAHPGRRAARPGRARRRRDRPRAAAGDRRAHPRPRRRPQPPDRPAPEPRADHPPRRRRAARDGRPAHHRHPHRRGERRRGADDLRLELPEDPVPCRADALSLVEACKNLVNNAFRHGAAPVTLGSRREGASAVLAVGDRGPGMPEALWDGAGARYDRTGGGDAAERQHRPRHRRRRRPRPPRGAALRATAAGDFEAALVLPLGPAADVSGS